MLLCAAVANAQPADDARYLRLVHEYTLQSDGSVDYHHFRELKLESYYAFHRAHGETFVVYDTVRERLHIRESHTLMADDRKVVTPANAFNEVLPRQASGAPAYSHLREMVITHTGLERGATIILDYVKKSFPGSVSFFSGMEEMAADAPVKAMTFILRHPSGSPLYFKALNTDVVPEVSNANGMTTYRWEFSNLPIAGHEALAGPTNNPVVMWSTLNDFKAAWLEFAAQPAFALKCDADMMMFADSLRAVEPRPVELSLAIAEHLKEAVREYSLDLEQTAYGSRTSVETWHSAGGTALERAALLAALCRAAGLDAVPVLVTEASLFDPSLPVMQMWQQPLVQISANGRTYCLDPGGQNKAPAENSLQGKLLLPIIPGASPDPRPVAEVPVRARIQFKLVLGTDGKIGGEAGLELEGAANPYFALLKAGDKAAALGSVPGYRIEAPEADAKIGPERSVLKVRMQARDSLAAFGGLQKLVLPFFPLPLDALARQGLPDERRGDIRLPHPVDIALSWDIELPDGHRLASTIEKDGGDTPAGRISHRMGLRGSTWTINQEALIPATASRANYKEFRDMLELWQAPHLTTFWVAPAE